MMILCISLSRMYIIPDILLLRCTFYLEYFDTRVYTLPDILVQGCTPYLIFWYKGVHLTRLTWYFDTRMYTLPRIFWCKKVQCIWCFATRVYTLPDILIQECTLYLPRIFWCKKVQCIWCFATRVYTLPGILLQGCTPYLIFCCKGVHPTSFWNCWIKLLMVIISYKLTGHPNLICHYPGCTMYLK